MAENEQPALPPSALLSLSLILYPSRCFSDPLSSLPLPSRRLNSLRSGASHDSPTVIVGPRLWIAHALHLATAMTHACMRVCTHARTVRHATKREIIPRAACGPFVIRPYRRGGTDTRGRERERG